MVTAQSYDYIIVGAGPPGMVAADKLTEAGLSVLLIERGPPSTGQWGGTKKPNWLDGTDLTRFDVPGLENEIWVSGGSTDIFCPDVGQPAGCQFGGGFVRFSYFHDFLKSGFKAVAKVLDGSYLLP